MTEHPLDAFAREYNDAWNARDVDRILSFWADDGVMDDVPFGKGVVGIDAVRKGVQEWLTAFPDMHSEQEGRSISVDDAVAYEWRLTGTNEGPYDGRPATGKRIEYRGLAVLEVNDERKIVRHTDYRDTFTILTQMGHL
jgi:steroid delta-isomerase-like uncharacterized protein